VSPVQEPSSGLRVYFAIELVFWLGWLALDLATVSSQLKIARMVPIANMPLWLGLSVIVNVALVMSSALGVRHGRGVTSRHFGELGSTSLLVAGIVFRLVLGVVMMIWLTTMSGLQSV
jgi:hypothetical protein